MKNIGYHVMALLIQTLILGNSGGSVSSEPLAINLNIRRPSHMVDKHFVSFMLNPTDLLQGRPFGMANNSTLAMLKGLAPAYVRLGGPDTDRYVFRSHSNNGADDTPHNADEVIVTEEHWRKVNDFLGRGGLDVIACINSAHRGGASNKWDPRNALQLITYSDRMQYNITWQLGYEHTKEEGISGTQQGKDLAQLRSILDAFPRYQHAKIIGPDVRVLHKKDEVEHVLDLLIEAGPAINAVTWHPRWPHATAITPSDTSADGYDFPPDYLEWDRNQLHKLLQRALLKKPFWISEPRTEHAGSFAEGIIFARRLANAAKLGIEVVMKEPSLKDIAHPKPEYWVALLHKRTLGQTVLDARSLFNQSEVSVAVHCTNRGYEQSQDGGVSVLAVNTHGTEQKATIRGFPLGRIGENLHQYILTAGPSTHDIFSQMTYLNGEPILMKENGQLPEITPKTKRFGQNLLIKLPPYSIGIWVVPQAKVPACQMEPLPAPLNFEEITNVDVLKSTQKGINNIKNMNDILVSKLLNPINSQEMNKEDSSNDEDASETQQRKSRQATALNELGQELRKRMEEMRKLINLNVNNLAKTARLSNSEESSIREAEKKIDGLVEDLKGAVYGADQQEEFGKFLEMSGLKNDFGKMMMNERRARPRHELELDADFELNDSDEMGRRSKRDAALNKLKKNLMAADSSKELDRIEAQYKKKMKLFRESMKQKEKKPGQINFEKINRELQEELLLKEITLLEKTEETLAEAMKSHMERHEALEEMMRDELEQMKDEKLTELLEIKSRPAVSQDISISYPNNLDPFPLLFLNGDEKLAKKRETEVNGTDTAAEPKKSDPLEAFKTFLKQRKEEIEKRQKKNDIFLELRNKFKLELPKINELKLPTLTPKETTTEVAVATTTTTTEGSSEIQPNVADATKKRRTEVLKYMSENIDNINKQERELEVADEGNEATRKARKAEVDDRNERASTITTMLVNRVLDTIFNKNNENDETFQDPKSNEGNTQQGQDWGTESENAEFVPSEFESERMATPDVENAQPSLSEGIQKFRNQPTQESLKFKPADGAHEIANADDSSTKTPAVLAEPTANSPKYENAAAPSKDKRTKREVSTTETSATAPQKINHLSNSHSKAVDGNTIVKKASSTVINNTTGNVVEMADSTLRLVFDKVIPAAYDEAKKEIEKLAIPDYLKNIGQIVENLEHIDTILKDVGKLAAEAATTDSKDHIQTIKRTKRDTGETGKPDITKEHAIATTTQDYEESVKNTETNTEYASDDEITESAVKTTSASNDVETSENDSMVKLKNHTDNLQAPLNQHRKLNKIENNANKTENTQKIIENSKLSEEFANSLTETTTLSPKLPIIDPNLPDDELLEILAKDPLLDDVLDKMAEEILDEEVEEKDLETTTTTQPPSVAAHSKENVRMKIEKSGSLKQAEDDPSTPMLAAEKNIIALIVENMLKHQEALKKIKEKREILHEMGKTSASRGYTRRARQSAQILQPPADENISRFLQKLQPGVYVVPSKDMANVHADQTIRTELGTNGHILPNVMTLNIYYDKKQPDVTASSPQQASVPAFQTTSYKNPRHWMSPLMAGAPPMRPVYQQVPAAVQHPHYTLPKLPESRYPAAQQNTQYAHPIMPKQYPQYSETSNPGKSVYTGVYAEPEVLQSNHNQIVGASATPQLSTWNRQFSQADTNNDPWKLAVKDKMPKEETHKNGEPQSWYVENSQHDTNSQKTDRTEVQDGNAKHAIEPYWNKTLKQIFQETSKDPFWKFLDPPVEDEEENQSYNLSSENHEENHRRKRSLSDVKTKDPFNSYTYFNVQPFEYEWISPSIADQSEFDSYLENNFLGLDDYNEQKRDRRSLLDNFIVKEKPQGRYPLENNLIYHRILTRPATKKFIDESYEEEKSVARMQFVPSKNPSTLSISNPSSTRSSNNVFLQSPLDSYSPSKRSLPDNALALSSNRLPRKRPSWTSEGRVEPQITQAQIRSIQNSLFDGGEPGMSFPDAAVTSMADSLALPLKQMYETVIEFLRKMFNSSTIL